MFIQIVVLSGAASYSTVSDTKVAGQQASSKVNL